MGSLETLFALYLHARDVSSADQPFSSPPLQPNQPSAYQWKKGSKSACCDRFPRPQNWTVLTPVVPVLCRDGSRTAQNSPTIDPVIQWEWKPRRWQAGASGYQIGMQRSRHHALVKHRREMTGSFLAGEHSGFGLAWVESGAFATAARKTGWDRPHLASTLLSVIVPWGARPGFKLVNGRNGWG